MSQAGSISGGGGGGGFFTLTGNSGGAVSPILNNINVIGSGPLSIAGNPGTATLTVTYSGGGGGTNTFHTDSGDATESGNAITIAGGTNINTVGAAATVTINLDDNVTISGNFTSTGGNLTLPGTSNDGTTSGIITVGLNKLSFADDFNIYMGYMVGTYPNVTSVSNNIAIGQTSLYQIVAGPIDNNIAIGVSAMGSVQTNTISNVAVGNAALGGMNIGAGNVAIGSAAVGSLLSGDQNTGIGSYALQFVQNGNANIALGYSAGSALTTTDSNNICIGALGSAGDNAVMRLGDTGTIISSFIAGAYGVTPAMSPQMMTIGSDGEIGSQALPGGFTWNEETGTSAAMDVNNGYIANNGGLVTLTLPATAALGDIIEVCGKGAGGWSIAQNSGQTIHFGASSTTTGATGSLSSTLQYDAVRMVCITADTDFVVLSSVGNLTVA